MAELTIRPDEIRDALARFVEAYEPESASLEEVGTVVECGDGIARVEGLPSAMANELLEFEDGTRGLALNSRRKRRRWCSGSRSSSRCRPASRPSTR